MVFITQCAGKLSCLFQRFCDVCNRLAETPHGNYVLFMIMLMAFIAVPGCTQVKDIEKWYYSTISPSSGGTDSIVCKGGYNPSTCQ